MLEVTFAKPGLPRSESVALLIGERERISGLHETIEQLTDGALGRALRAARFSGKKNETASVLAPGGELARVVAVGLGKASQRTRLTIEEAGGTAGALLEAAESALLAADALPPELAAAAAHGAVLRSYRFDRYRTRPEESEKARLKKLTVANRQPARARAAFAALRALAEGVFCARDLVSEPANVLTPAAMAERCVALGAHGLEVEVLDPDDLERLGFGALLGVARGSANDPRVVVLQWHGKPEPGKSPRPLAFLGKGVTFDAGGLSLKSAAGMADMKWDMAGAAAVVGLLRSLAERGAKVEAIGLLGLAENMPSGHAQRPGDVVTSASGQTVEVVSTDAEGRLLLADLLWYCQDRFQPACMIDLATLTGAIVVALGHERAGLFSNNDALAAKLVTAGEASGERLWRMPLDPAYGAGLRSDIADMRNAAGRTAGAITAALFLERFVKDTPWAHLDIAGTAWAARDRPLAPKGASAFGVRLLDRLVQAEYER